jgi:2-polyprenyl-6-hydroxyphenyl methylase/3-demethylubiquinone-9 3-methyltransferase
MTTTTINPQEAAHFGGLASDWWDPKGRSAMLHALNPVRLAWLREQVDAHWDGDPRAMRPLTGRSVLDVGCGAGLMCEPLARMGASVTGVDSAPENAAIANDHACEQGLAITYLAQEVAQVLGHFDLVTAMEVVEHVSDPAGFVQALADHVAPGGLLIMSTPNRTALSRIGMVGLAERFGMVPPGTHHWDQFITPDELGELLTNAGMRVVATKGIGWSLTRGLHLSDSLEMNYLVAAVRG